MFNNIAVVDAQSPLSEFLEVPQLSVKFGQSGGKFPNQYWCLGNVEEKVEDVLNECLERKMKPPTPAAPTPAAETPVSAVETPGPETPGLESDKETPEGVPDTIPEEPPKAPSAIPG